MGCASAVLTSQSSSRGCCYILLGVFIVVANPLTSGPLVTSEPCPPGHSDGDHRWGLDLRTAHLKGCPGLIRLPGHEFELGMRKLGPSVVGLEPKGQSGSLPM